jgi:hypothetical protein
LGRWTYYAPLWLGVLVILSLNDAIRGSLGAYEPWQQWAIVFCGAIAGGLHCQMLMLGSQGAFAQVLPAPGGRSIRGTPAVAAGWLLVAWFVLGIATLLLLLEGVSSAALVAGALTGAALLAAAAIYAWNLPAAVVDFRADRS